MAKLLLLTVALFFSTTAVKASSCTPPLLAPSNGLPLVSVAIVGIDEAELAGGIQQFDVNYQMTGLKPFTGQSNYK